MTYAWKNMNLVPRNALEAWHQYEPAVSGHQIIYDYSGNNRTISCSVGNAPVLTSNVLNGQPGWYFNGSRDPLAYTGNLTIKHLFIVASYEDANFGAEYRGLLSGVSSGDLLVANNVSSDLFLDLGLTLEYRKSDVLFAANNQKAPMSNQFAVIEISIPGGVTFDGIQVGQQRGFTARKWKGHFFEQLLYSETLNSFQRCQIYQYLAMRYHLWQKNADGLSVFPFHANKTNTMERSKEVYLSEPYNGDPKALVRGNFKSGFELPFALRHQAEFEAAEKFVEQHFPLNKYVFRNTRFYPAKDYICRITSPLREQGSDVSFRFNYSFDSVETD